MKFGALLLVGTSFLIANAAVAAPSGQSAPASGGGSASDYLCTFAGKCGTTTTPADSDAAPTMAAPATKGFRLAGPQQSAPASQPSMAAPATRSFRLATVATAPRQTRPVTRVAHNSIMGAKLASTGTIAPQRVASTGARANLMLSFEYNSDKMTDAAQDRARGFAQALLAPELKDKRFLIEGHTDARGARDLNVDLSRRRAQSVADFLVAQGVDRSRVDVKGVGPDAPLPGHSPSSEANRRVEAVLVS